MTTWLNRFWVSSFRIPTATIVTHRRIVDIYNVTMWATRIFVIILFVFILRGWARTSSVVLIPNMWISEPHFFESLLQKPYCSAADYTYDHDWVYNNITCKPEPSSVIFQKEPGRYFVNTFVQRYVLAPNPSSAGAGFVRIGETGSHFIPGIENVNLTLSLDVLVPEFDFDSRDSSNPPLEATIISPSGKRRKISERGSLSYRLTVQEWIDLFELDGGLDGAVSSLSVSASQGDCRARLAGMQLGMSVQVRNQLGGPWWVPFQNFAMDIHLSSTPAWQRTILTPTPPDETGKMHMTDVYGAVIDITEFKVDLWSGVLQPDVLAFFRTIVRVFVIITAAKQFVIHVALKCMGDDSKRWAHAAFTPIDEMTQRRVASIIRQHNIDKEEAAVDSFLTRLMHLEDKDHRNILAELDKRRNGSISIGDIEDLIDREPSLADYGGPFLIEALLRRADRDGDLKLDRSELEGAMRQIRRMSMVIEAPKTRQAGSILPVQHAKMNGLVECVV